jgi:hypothetical protein
VGEIESVKLRSGRGEAEVPTGPSACVAAYPRSMSTGPLSCAGGGDGRRIKESNRPGYAIGMAPICFSPLFMRCSWVARCNGQPPNKKPQPPTRVSNAKGQHLTDMGVKAGIKLWNAPYNQLRKELGPARVVGDVATKECVRGEKGRLQHTHIGARTGDARAQQAHSTWCRQSHLRSEQRQQTTLGQRHLTCNRIAFRHLRTVPVAEDRPAGVVRLVQWAIN